MKYKILYFIVSMVFLVPGVVSLISWGVKPSIDFTGGALLEVKLKDNENINTDILNKKINEIEEVQVSSIQSVSGSNNYIIKLNNISEEKKNDIVNVINEIKSDTELIRFETVGPLLGKELLIKTAIAVFIVASVILLYVAYQFKDKVYGLSAIIAMFHDTLILLGIFSILGKYLYVEVDTLFVTALLTTLSFSVHDTIVVFDRIREITKNKQAINIEEATNMAINQTLTRSLNNSLTIIFMLTALSVLGGITTKWFVTALLIGTISGTYSSTFTASPILIYLSKMVNRKKS